MSLNAEQVLLTTCHSVHVLKNSVVVFRTKKTLHSSGLHVLEKSVLDRAFTDAIDSQAVSSGGQDFLNVDQLEMNFDHSASSGIIGTATNDAHGNDNDAVNWDKYHEFLDKMCDCDSSNLFRSGWLGLGLGPFTPEDVSIFYIV